MPDEITQEQIEAIAEATKKGNKIEAIKLYREATGKGLKEAKDFIESLEADLAKQGKDGGGGRGSLGPKDLRDSLITAITEKGMIAAIKIHREATGMGLKDSKDHIDSLILELKEEDPEKHAEYLSKRKGCASVLCMAFGFGGGLLYWMLP